MNTKQLKRISIYLAGMLTLAFGISLNVKTGLGVSPIISMANCFSSILSLPIGDTTFVLYSVFVIIQIIVHIHLSRKNSEIKLRSLIIKDILQLPLSLVFTRIMNVFEIMIPQMDTLQDGFFSSMPGRFVALAAAIIATGVGAAATLDMRLIPNPGDGIVQSLSDLSKKETGFVKNVFDGINVSLTVIISLIAEGNIIGIGAGTIIAFLGVGRVIAVFNHFLLPYLRKLV